MCDFNDMEKSLSIVIPCYNMEKYLERCYKSLAIQKEADDVEFIFVNDGSEDRTLDILNDIKARDNRVVLINQENSGVSAARNSALCVVKGKYIYILDADDYLSAEDVILHIKSLILKYDPDIIIPSYNTDKSGELLYHKVSIPTGVYSKFQLFDMVGVFPTNPQLLYRTSILEKNNLRFKPEIRCGEVYAFTISYLKCLDSGKICVSDKPCQNYFERFDSAVHKINYKNDLTVVEAVESIYKNGSDLLKYPSFRLTAFLLYGGFIYTKYLKSSLLEKEMLCSVKVSLSNRTIKRCVKNIAFKPHISRGNRLLALYLLLMPKKMGFKLLRKLYSVKTKSNN